MKLSAPELQACTAARQAMAGQQFERAEQIYQDLLQTFPQSVAGRVNLANLYLQRNDYQAAQACLAPLAEPDCQVAEWWFSWSLVQAALGAWSDALQAAEQAGRYGLSPQLALRQRCTALQHLNQADQAIALARTFAAELPRAENQAFYAAMLNESGQARAALAEATQAVALAEKTQDSQAKLEALRVQAGALVNTHQLDAALATYQTLRQAGQADADLQYNQSLAHLLKGDWAAGFALYEARFQSRIFGKNRRVFPGQRWAGEALGHATLTVIGEQGLGDRIHFARYLPLLRQAFPQARLRYVCLPALQALLQPYVQSQQIEWLADTEENLAKLAADWTIPLMSLPHVLGQHTGEAALPPPAQFEVGADARAQAGRAWQSFCQLSSGPAKKVKVGLVNAGGRALAKDHDRSIPLAALESVLHQPDVLWVNLQPDLRDESLAWLAAHPEVAFFNPMSALVNQLDFAATAALIENLDLVITVDTAVAHLAASLGRPTWLLNRFNPDWRWQLGRPDAVWYPSVQQFRQTTLGDWSEPIAHCATALAEFVAEFIEKDKESSMSKAIHQPAEPLHAAQDLQAALVAVDRGEFDAAANTALQVLHTQPAQPVALFILALQAEHQQRWQDAAELLRLALQTLPHDVSILIALARVESQRQRWQACVDALALCLFLEPTREDIANDLVALQTSYPMDTLPAAQCNAQGQPRFVLPIPNSLRRDLGVAYLIQHETQYGGYEFSTRAFLEAHLQAGDGLIDVGAHWGIFSLAAATHPAGNIQVWAIEPDPLNRTQLTVAAHLNQVTDRLRILPCAAGAQPAELVLQRNTTMGHSLSADSQADAQGTVRVPVLPLDQIFKDLDLPNRLFLKVDAEGFDVAVIEGALHLISSGKVVCIIWEKGIPYDRGAPRAAMASMLKTLSEFGFVHYRFDDENAGGSLQPFVLDDKRCNIFSVRPAVQPQASYVKTVGQHAPTLTHDATPEVARRLASQAQQQTDVTRWANPQQLEQAWDKRARFISEWIPLGARVLDLGCGAMNLRDHLADGCRYQGCDVVARTSQTVVCDFNRGEFPATAAAQASHITLLGVLEYIYDLPIFLNRLRATGKPIVLSYCSTSGVIEHSQRQQLGWVNHLSNTQLEALFTSAGLTIGRKEQIDAVQFAYQLVPHFETVPKLKKVGILSYSNVGNFGDRLGTHVIHGLLPAHAVVKPIFFKPFTLPEEELDLLILGIGNSLFKPLMTPQLTALLKRSKHAIGVFGTQYRQQIDPVAMRAIIESLDHWHARYAEDALLYGQGLNHVSHLGDCLVSQFPLTTPALHETLRIGDEVWEERGLDRTISHIQQYKKVHSTRLHPLLCALTSAEEVAYVEQRESGTHEISGKFGAMLYDVFGRRFPEGQWWSVEQAAVQRYKHQVQMNLLALQEQIQRLLA